MSEEVGDSRKRWIRAGLIAAVVAAIAIAYNLWRIEAVIESEPPGAVVRIDGRGIGITPLTVSLSPGRHQVELTHSHFEPQTLSLEVNHGDRIHERVTFQRGVGRLSLLSNPRGAWVELDGKRLEGVTPMEVEAPTGPVTVRMGLPERRPAEKAVVVLADQTLEVNVPLNIDPHGSLTVVVSPADARVTFPELDVVYQPGVRIPIGEQLIQVSRPGYETQQIRFEIRYDDNVTRVSLTRAFGTIRVRVSPSDANVTLTFEAEPGRMSTVPYQAETRVPVGPVEVKAQAMGFRTAVRKIAVDRQGAAVDLALSPMNVRAGETFRDGLAAGGEGPLMIVIPPGEFVMGKPGGPPSVTPANARVLAQPFAVSVYEVTVADYARFAAASGKRMDERLTDQQEPIRYLAWSDAVAYADWLTSQTGQKYRLPTEAEWEYVARGGTSTDYFFGDDPERLCEFANLADQSTRQIYREWAVAPCDDGYGKLAPVGAYAANPFGLHDVLGNVAEWVQECGMPPYSWASEDGSVVNRGESCDTHSLRGGSWDSQPDSLRVFHRASSRDRGDDHGIRLVKEL